jgi:hypothetical protein
MILNSGILEVLTVYRNIFNRLTRDFGREIGGFFWHRMDNKICLYWKQNIIEIK